MTALMGLDVRLKMARLFLRTDARSSLQEFADFLEAVFSGGVEMVLLDDPRLNAETELEALDLARTISYRHQGLIVVNGRPEVAKKSDADVLHLGDSDTQPKVARTFLHQWGIIGRTVESSRDAAAAADDPEVNYLWVGGDERRLDLDLVADVAAKQPSSDPRTKPWFATGVTDPRALDAAIDAGARRVVVGSAITEARNPEQAARALSDRLRRAWDEDPGMDAYSRSLLSGAGKSFQANPDGTITPDGPANAPIAMPTGEPADPTPGEGSSQFRRDDRSDRRYGRDR